MRTFASLALVLPLVLCAAGCGADSSPDAAAGSPDATPGSLDAEPQAPDAEPQAPDAEPHSADAAPGCTGGWPDPATGLCWQNPSDPDTFDQSGAVAHCEALTAGGYDDWRVPTIDELRSLVQGCADSETGGACPVTDGSTFDDWTFDCTGCMELAGSGASGCYLDAALQGTCDDTGFWSASPIVGTASDHWGIFFYDAWITRSQGAYHVRCVR